MSSVCSMIGTICVIVLVVVVVVIVVVVVVVIVVVVGRCEGAFGGARLSMLVCFVLQFEVTFLTRCVAFA